jgi:hypothetical protein
MKCDMWVIEWNQRAGHFHISPTETWEKGNPDYQEVGMVMGRYGDACDWATQWLERNPKAKAAYRSPFRGYEPI